MSAVDGGEGAVGEEGGDAGGAVGGGGGEEWEGGVDGD